MNILSVKIEISKYYKGVKKKKTMLDEDMEKKKYSNAPASGSINGNNYYGEKLANIYRMLVCIHDTCIHIYNVYKYIYTYINTCIICIYLYIYIYVYMHYFEHRNSISRCIP